MSQYATQSKKYNSQSDGFDKDSHLKNLTVKQNRAIILSPAIPIHQKLTTTNNT